MADYFYRGRDADGRLVEGQLEAASQSALVQTLRRQNITPTQVQIAKGRKAKAKASATPSRGKSDGHWLSRLFRARIKLDELIMFCRQMHALTRSGIPLLRAINGLADASRSPRLSAILHDVTRSLTQGSTLSTALRAHPDAFNDLFVAMIRVGETTGRLDAAFQQLIGHLEREKSTRKQLAAATRYPLFVSISITSAMLIINFRVIPAFSGVFASLGADLPWPTRVLIASSNFLLVSWPYLLVLLALGIYGLIRWKRTPQGAVLWDRALLKVPLMGKLYERIALGRFARPFAMMLDAGVPMLQALQVCSRTVGNHYIGRGIEGMVSGIERGESLLATASGSGMFDSLILQMIGVGEETGNVADLLVDIADFYDQEVDYDLKRMTELIEPILLAFMGGMVVILVLGVFLPMWDLGSAYGG
ncbi:type II secretion system F family protein [Saccharospirillum mangrovi]|uniref:type II secretion system F family protein n=1 Tax=Saccharospirillum mangrovi TaxID=2161747 RepID=UPI0018E5A0FF|nr:type II secretion system F family protein [Saccharospirillum mangrovi]